MMNYHMMLSIFHIFIVAPLFLGVAFLRSATPDWLYHVMLVLGIIIFVFHFYKMIGRWFARSPYLWVNSIHVFYVAPLLMYVGYHKKETMRAAYELMALLGFAVLGYHLYSLVNEIQLMDKNSA